MSTVMSTADRLGAAAVALADAALEARRRGDYIHARRCAKRAAEALEVAKSLGWRPDAASQQDSTP